MKNIAILETKEGFRKEIVVKRFTLYYKIPKYREIKQTDAIDAITNEMTLMTFMAAEKIRRNIFTRRRTLLYKEC